MGKHDNQNTEKFWKEKEQEIGEKIIGKDMSEYISGYQEVKEKTWGLLYYTESSFYFQTFPKKSWLTSLLGSGQGEYSGETTIFRILWKDMKEVCLPTERKTFFTIFSPPDCRVLIKHYENSKEKTLVLMMYSRDNRNQFIEFYRNFSNKK